MKSDTIRVLIVEDNPTDVLIVQDELAHTGDTDFFTVHVEQLKEALIRLKAEHFDVVLLDLSLPDSHGLETFVRLHTAAPEVPLVVLSGQADKNLAIKAVQAGAQDYLVKGHMGEDVLSRSIKYAIERQRSAEDLRATHAQLRQMLEHSPAVICVLKVQGQNLVPHLVSENVTELLGFTVPESLRPEWWLGQLHPEDRDRAVASVAETLTQQGTSLTEYRLRHRDGSYRWVEDNRRLTHDSSNLPVEIVSVWADITERKRADELLRETARRKVGRQNTRLKIELAVILVIGVLSFIFLHFSDLLQAPVRQFALKYLDILDEIIEALVIVWLGTVAVFYRRWRAFQVQAGDQLHVQEALRTLHGELETRVQQRTTELAKSNEALRGEVIKHQQAEQALRESDEKFRQIAANINEVFSITDSSMSQIHYISPAYEKIWGRTCASLYESPRLWLAAVHPEDRARILTAAETQQTRGDYEETYRITRPDGAVRWIHARAVPVRNPAGQVERLVGVTRDITAQKRAEAELATTHRELLETSRKAGMAEVATEVLHNVGNVLNSVNVASSCVADSIRNSKAANLSKVVALLREHEADLGAFLTDDPKGRQIPGYLAQLAEHLGTEQTAVLKGLAGLQTNIEHIKEIVVGQQSFAKVSGLRETLSITDLVEDALRMDSSAPAPDDVEVIKAFEKVPLVTVEKHKVLQILVNLIQNARQSCGEAGGPEKRLTLRVTNGNDRVRIEVTDNGMGILPENLTRIFVHGFTTKKSGHGFGLHSAALAARGMGGSLTAHSDGPGRGATFSLELPFTSAEAANE